MKKLLLRVVGQKYQRYATEVIESLKKAKVESLTGEESRDNVWDEYVSQLRRDNTIPLEQYRWVVKQHCLKVIEKLPEDEINLLWLLGPRERYPDHYPDFDENTLAGRTDALGEIADEMVLVINGVARPSW